MTDSVNRLVALLNDRNRHLYPDHRVNEHLVPLTDAEAEELATVLTEHTEARDLARALWAALTEIADDYAAIIAVDPRLDPDDALPTWLTGASTGPGVWEADDPHDGLTIADVDPGALEDAEEADRIAEFVYDAQHDEEQAALEAHYDAIGDDPDEYLDDDQDDSDEGPF